MRSTLSIILLLSFSLVNGQDNRLKLSIDISPRIKYTLIHVDDFGMMTPTEYEKAFRFNGDTHFPLIRLNGGITLSYNITERICAGLGFGIAALGDGYTRDINYVYSKKTTMRYVSFPLFAKYRFIAGERGSLFITAKYIGNIAYQSKIVTNRGGQKSKEKYGSITDIVRRRPNLNGEYSIGLGYGANKNGKLRLEVEPNISYIRNKVNTLNHKRYYYTVGIGVRFFIL